MSWLKFVHKVNAYEQEKANKTFDDHADPTIQLEQAMHEAQKNAEELANNAASVIANKKMTEMRLSRAQTALDEATSNAKAAVTAAQAHPNQADKYQSQARNFAQQAMAAQEQVETLKHTLEVATQAADQAQQRVTEEQEMLQELMARKQTISSKIDQAKMEEAMQKSLATLSSTGSGDAITPTFDHVEEKVEERFAKADAASQISGQSAEVTALDIHHERLSQKADDFLASLTASDAPAVTAGS